jgi:2-dehydro-3-deoxyphosphogluconate aldolase/(4S)-4-hydroxy-2-oxoglutarate aldolase
MSDTAGLLDVSAVIPVVTIDDPEHAVPVARALLAGGIGIIELTLRTERALESLALIAADVPDILVGAGTVLNPTQADEAVSRGAQFLVSPGVTPALLRHVVEGPVPFLPGVATVGEAMYALEHGVTELKFFPAGPAGGPRYLAALAAPLPQVRFCPTGGVTPDNMADYLALLNVGCVGGSWLTPGAALAAQDWDQIAELARAAVAATTSHAH